MTDNLGRQVFPSAQIRKNLVRKYELANIEAATGTSYSDPIDIQYVDHVAIQVIWSNGSVSTSGNLYIEASIKEDIYTDLDLGLVPFTGVSGSHLFDLDLPFDKVRAKVAVASGTADLEIWAMAKAS